ncbi:immunity protein TriTu family protein [Erythrobacter longus]|nr:hypothetical protein [Erythrobacter longus]
MMFSFDKWADWFGDRVRELDADQFMLIEPYDNRDIPECKSNPSFGLQLDSADRLGYIGFWKNGLCDYQLIDADSAADLVNEAGLEANDETVESLLATFLAFYED